MKQTKRQLKALAAMNLDFFKSESIAIPSPATLYTKIKEKSGAVAFAVSDELSNSSHSTSSNLPPIEELYHLFERFNWMYFEGRLQKTEIEYSNRMTSAGAYYPTRKLIKIGRRYHELFPEDLHDTLKHEMIHIIHFKHDAAFKAKANQVGASLRAKSHPSLRRKPKWLYICDNCQTEYPRQKRFRMASCGICSPNGRYDRRYKLRLIDSLKRQQNSE